MSPINLQVLNTDQILAYKTDNINERNYAVLSYYLNNQLTLFFFILGGIHSPFFQSLWHSPLVCYPVPSYTDPHSQNIWRYYSKIPLVCSSIPPFELPYTTPGCFWPVYGRMDCASRCGRSNSGGHCCSDNHQYSSEEVAKMFTIFPEELGFPTTLATLFGTL